MDEVGSESEGGCEGQGVVRLEVWMRLEVSLKVG